MVALAVDVLYNPKLINYWDILMDKKDIYTKLTCHNGMVTINSNDLDYSNIRNMYTENRSGYGIQVSESVESKSDRILHKCTEITNLLYELNDILESD